MSLASNLRHRCTIQRPTITKDDYDHDIESWSPPELERTDVHCRLKVDEERVPLSELAERPVVTVYRLLVGPRADVQQGDRIVDLVFEDGSTDAGPYRIESVLPRRSRRKHHITLKLEKVT